MLATVPSVTAVSRASLLTGALRTGGQAEETRRLRRLLGQAQVRALPQGGPRPRARPSPGWTGPRRDRQRRHRGRRRAQRDRRRPGQGKARPGALDRQTRSRTCARFSTRRAAPAARSSSPPTTATCSTRGRTNGPASRTRRTRQSPKRPATGSARREPARSPSAARASRPGQRGRRSSPRSTRRSITPPGALATTAARPRPRSSSRSSSCCRPTACSHPAGAPTTPPGTPLPGGTPRRPLRAARGRTGRRTRPSRAQPRRRRAAAVAPDGNALFDVTEAAPAPRQQARPSATLGAQVVASPRMASQRQAIPRAPGRGRRRRADRRARSGRRTADARRGGRRDRAARRPDVAATSHRSRACSTSTVTLC